MSNLKACGESSSFVLPEGKNNKVNTGAQIMRKIFLLGLSFIDSANPLVKCLTTVVEKVFSFIQERHLEPLTPVFFGLVMCFFGGFFTLFITAVEVIRLTTWDSMKTNFFEIYKNYCAAREANMKDNLLDEDENGIPDVQEMDKNDLFSRKLWLFCNSVDPLGLQQAIRGLLFSFAAVMTSISGKLTICLTCGCTLADFARKHLRLDEAIADILPPQQKKLAGTISGTFLYFISVCFALLFEQYIMTARSALRGAELSVEHLIIAGLESGVVGDDLTYDSKKGKMMVFGLAFLGFFWQVSQNFTLPFPLNILLFPLSFTEWSLKLLIKYFSMAQIV